MIYELISKVLINVLFISIFISIFFFTYGTYIEKKVITNQMNILAGNFMDTIKLFGNTANTNLYNYVNNNVLTPENITAISAEDKTALAGNTKIINKVILYVIGFILGVILIVGLLKLFTQLNKNKEQKQGQGQDQDIELNITSILIESSIILIFIAITEFSFLTFFGEKFISIDTNKVKLEIVKNLQDYSNSLNNTSKP